MAPCTIWTDNIGRETGTSMTMVGRAWAVPELIRARSITAGLHARCGRQMLPDPLRLAAAEGLRMAPGPSTIALEDRAIFRVTTLDREQGILIAQALAASIMLRRGIRYTDARSWALVVELLVPEWVWSWGSLDVVAVAHASAPPWLLGICHAARAA